MLESRFAGALLLAGVMLALSGCGGGASPGVAAYSIGGTVTGLTGSGLIIQDNGADDLTVGASGAFRFSSLVNSGSGYAVSIKTQPANPAQFCSVSTGTGTVAAADISNVSISCVSNFSVGGTISGLTGVGLVLENNSADDLQIAANGAFSFPSAVAIGSNYQVTVKTQPGLPAQSCSVTSGAGVIGTSPVTNVLVTCINIPCLRIVRNQIGGNPGNWGEYGAPVGYASGGSATTFTGQGPASFTLENSSLGYSFLGLQLNLVQNTTYALRATVSNYSGNYPGTNFEILGAPADAFLGVYHLNFENDGVFALVFTYLGPDAPYLARVGINADDAPSSATGPGGFTVSDISLEILRSASSAPSEYVPSGYSFGFNYANLDSYDASTGLLTEAQGPDCDRSYSNVWAITADSFGDNTYSFPNQLANVVAEDYVFFVDSVPGRKLSVAQTNIDALLSNTAPVQTDTQLPLVSLPTTVAKPNGLIVEGGVNDIIQDATLSQMQAVISSILGDLKAKRLGAILLTVSPFGHNSNWTPAREQVRVAYNQWLLTQASSGDHINVYDMAANVSNGGLADDNDSTILDASVDLGDGVHPNAQGGSAIAAAIKKILDLQSLH